ncbi:MAG TPA: metal-dependent transcriptional regulator [Terriglobia bacterium]|nr:metal-dependent transcriptional regulator [Terriglobia bacterium]
MAEHASISQEDYLKVIYKMLSSSEEPISARLSEQLKVTPPAVTTALKRMARHGYVRLDSRSGHIRLTRQGRRIARRLVLRHRLVEKLLTEVLGMDWKVVHEEAEKLEHAISEEVERRLLEYFGRDGTCPHGYPLFGGVAKLRRQGAKPLDQEQPGARLKVVRVDEGFGFLEFLDRLHIRPGTEVRVIDRTFDETMTLAVGSRRHYLAKSTTARIWVKKV